MKLLEVAGLPVVDIMLVAAVPVAAIGDEGTTATGGNGNGAGTLTAGAVVVPISG